MSGRRCLGITAILATLSVALVDTPAKADASTIGSWTLLCPSPPGGAGCILRLRDGIPVHIGGEPVVALEVQARGSVLVPVITLHGLTMQAAVAGALLLKPTVALRFDDGPPVPLGCGLDAAIYRCAPEGAAIAATSAALPTARFVSVRIVLAAAGMPTLPPVERRIALEETAKALASLRAAGAAGETEPAEAGLDWRGFLGKLKQSRWFAKGTADATPTGAASGESRK
ncbi:MAG TPA: hypothetical protein VIG49_09455 [Acetobacteraceae bacterium]